jgi:8-oxo-dGTP pyrophosphatase MutT (NUDIX family)
MVDIPVQLSTAEGEYLGKLRQGAHAIISGAEDVARDRHLSKRNALSVALRELLEEAGFEIGDKELGVAANKLDAARRGEKVVRIDIEVRRSQENGHPHRASGKKTVHDISNEARPMTGKSDTSQVVSFFEVERKYPDDSAKAWYERLVGLDQQKHDLLVKLEMLLYPERVADWSRKHHSNRGRCRDWEDGARGNDRRRACEESRRQDPRLLTEDQYADTWHRARR